jgi:hypothetical protein
MANATPATSPIAIAAPRVSATPSARAIEAIK